MSPVRSSHRLPALDGMRGLALLGMLAWHAQIGWVKGGFARMTIFFVLAGYLATTSQLRLLDGSGARPFVQFWSRRARRLMPVTVLGVLASIATTAAVSGPVARDQALGDTVSVLLSFSNWRFILSAREYGALFETSSAFQHYWSLSVEEQCFIVLPLVLAGVTALAHRLRPGQRGVATAVGLASLGAVLAAAPLVITMSADAAYYSTVVRGGEFLAGAAFAVWWRHRGQQRAAELSRRWDVAGTAGLAILLAVMLTMEREAEWLYRGGMGLFALPAVALLGGIVARGRVVSGALGVRPLEVLGRWAFPIYVLHWPLFLVMDATITGLDRRWLVTLEIAASVALGGLVHRWIERPLMPLREGSEASAAARWWWGRPRRAVPIWGSCLAICLLVASQVPSTEPAVDFAAAEDEHTSALSTEDAEQLLDELDELDVRGQELSHDDIVRILDAAGVEAGDVPVFRDSARRGVGLFGGSTALSIALGGGRLGELYDDHESVPGYSWLGCGLLEAGVRGDRSHPPDPHPPHPVPEVCHDRDRRWAATAVVRQIDVAVIAASLMEMMEWQLPDDGEWRTLGDPVLDAQLEQAMRSAIDAFASVGVEQVVLLTPIPPLADMDPARAEERRRRQEAYRALAFRVAKDTDAAVVDLGGWIELLSEDERSELAPDGVHPAQEGARRIWEQLLGPAVVAQSR